MKSKIVYHSILIGIVGLAGCQWIAQPAPIVREPVSVTPEPTSTVQSTSHNMENRFTEGPTETDAVQSAVMWSEKYEHLLETSNELRDRNMQLFEENTELKDQVEDLSSQLTQTRKELDEANAFLQKMHLELNDWKADVLGFREELRKAQVAQLQALGKILRILGAEPIETNPVEPSAQPETQE